MTFNKEFMQEASKRIDELQQEIIDASKKIPNSEDYVKSEISKSGIVSFSKCKKCNKILHISDLKLNPDGIGRICFDTSACDIRVEKQQESFNEDK